MYLKPRSSLPVSGPVVRLWVFKTNVGSGNLPSAAYCNSIYNKKQVRR